MSIRIAFLLLTLVCGISHAELTAESEKKIDAAVKAFYSDLKIRIKRINDGVPGSSIDFSPSETLLLEQEYRQDALNHWSRAERLFKALGGQEGHGLTSQFGGRAQANGNALRDLLLEQREIDRKNATDLKNNVPALREFFSGLPQEQRRRLVISNPLVVEEYQRLVAAKRLNLDPRLAPELPRMDVVEGAKARRAELLREMLRKLPDIARTIQIQQEGRSFSENVPLNGVESVAFLERLARTMPMPGDIHGIYELKNAFGSEYKAMDMATQLQSRIVDVLARMNTVESWSAVARLADGSSNLRVRTNALLHLMATPTPAKLMALSKVEGPGPFLAAARKMMAQVPPRFSEGKLYYDLRTSPPTLVRPSRAEFKRDKAHLILAKTPYGFEPGKKYLDLEAPVEPGQSPKVVRFHGGEEEFASEGAKSRFVPEHAVLSDNLAAMRDAVQTDAPIERWSWLPSKWKKAAYPPKPPAPAAPVPPMTTALVPYRGPVTALVPYSAPLVATQQGPNDVIEAEIIDVRPALPPKAMLALPPHVPDVVEAEARPMTKALAIPCQHYNWLIPPQS